IAPVTAVCAVIVPLIVGAFLGERPKLPAMIGVAVAIVAIVLVSQSGEAYAATGVGTAIASGLIIGLFLVCLSRGGPSAGLWPLLAARVVSVSFFAMFVRGMPKRDSLGAGDRRRCAGHARERSLRRRGAPRNAEHRR